MASPKKRDLKKQADMGKILGVPAPELQEYVKFFNKNDLKELTIKERGATISLKRADSMSNSGMGQPMFYSQPAQSPAPAAGNASAPAKKESTPVVDDSAEKITSPIIGTYYSAPSPDAPPFLKEGQTVNKGETLCIVEAMKVMNKITAESTCKILKILVKNGQPVKSGEPLFLIEK